MNTRNAAPPCARPRGSSRSARGRVARGAGLRGLGLDGLDLHGPALRGAGLRGLRAGAAAIRVLAATFALAAAAAAPAGALAAEPSAAGLDLLVEDAPWTLDPDAVRAAVERELAGPVTAVSAASAGRPTLVLRGEPDGQVTLTFHAQDGRHIGRTIDLPQDPGRAAEAIALLAGNLVRDEAAELAAALSKRAPAAPTAPATAPAAPPASPAAAPASPAAAPPASPAADRPAPRPPRARPAPACALAGASSVLVGGDVVPLVGTSGVVGTNVVRRYSLNLLGGYTAGVDGVELSAGVNIESSFLCGAQISVVGNLVAGPVRGAQVTGGVNLSTSLHGAQIGLVNLAVGPVGGAQTGLANLAVGPVDGAQTGLANVATGPVAGAQSGLANLAVGPVDGAQIGLVNVATGELSGAQIGLANVVTGESTGMQAGLVNVARGKVKGAQIGLVNYAGDSPFSLGLLNFIRDGRLHLDVWGLESGIVMAGLKHGSDHFHNIYGVGMRLAGDRPLTVFTLGLGGRISIAERVYADVDVLGYSLHEISRLNPSAMMSQARALLGFRLSPDLALFGGPSYNIAYAESVEDARLSPYGSLDLQLDDTVATRGWPGVVLGVQVF
ncbi:hypothetical protein SOCEGT47_042460 [Sorangium cellulosum]|uniref:Uncharacterized protein n=1 Tax=Sorangium cellulosum TaxID=56 RepID=A0A4P2Q3X2_SORCE|nr:hypothetical protein [Sorangium cellulosum]AUX23716.1 hypothetical protein SOCEGT47_042460 [Sorangium cellulosum]